MTQEIMATHNEQPVPSAVLSEADETCLVLEQVRHNAVRLLGELKPAPRHLRVQAGSITVEIEWPETEPLSGGPAVTASRAEGSPPGPSVPATAAEPDGIVYLTAPMIGVFYTAPEPGADAFVKVGDPVRQGQRVGIIEAMKLMIPVEADRSGTVTEILKADGEPIEYGERLIALATDGG